MPASGPDTAIPGTILVPWAGLQALTSAPGFAADGPLWQRVPSRDEYGQLLADFRMLFPGLRRRSQAQQLQTLQAIGGVLQRYRRWVVFADLNLRMNLLWVSVRPRPGLTVEIPAAILEQVPEARLLAAYWRR